MSNLSTTNEILSNMQNVWVTANASDFHFGTPQEVDNLHNKTLPLLFVYTPQTRFETSNIQSSQWLAKTEWTVVLYNNLPSTYNVTNDLAVASLWDTMENQLLAWYESVYNTFEAQGKIMNITSALTVTRLKESSNDRLLGLKATFGWDYYRRCLSLN